MAVSIASVDSVIKKNQSNSDALHFPKKIGKYGILFMFADYKYDRTRDTVTQEDIGRYRGSVLLPLPKEGLSEASTFKISESQLGAVGAMIAGGISDPSSVGNDLNAAISGFMSVYDDGVQGFINAAPSAIQTAGALPVVLAALKSRKITAGLFTGAALLGGGAGLMKSIDVATGQTANDFEALTFDGASLRTHTFSWSLHPESYEETKIINAIKKKFLGAAHPTYTFGNSGDSAVSRILFDYPQMVLPYILIGNKAEHYYKFKPCLIKSVKFSYKGDAGMSFLKDGAPASVEMSIDLVESSIWTGEDYDRDGSGVDGSELFASRANQDALRN